MRSHGDAIRALGNEGVRILVDATADADTAANHAACLSAGIHVATACKLAAGTSLDQWRAIRDACPANGAGFGDRATVGAGLPLLRSIRELRAGGDRIHAVAGVMSGSLAWLFHNYDGSPPFSELVRKARDRGFTEPDPREDLSGEDVRRKILILARAAGFEIDSHQVDVQSLVPAEARQRRPRDQVKALGLLDEPLAARLAEANFSAAACGSSLASKAAAPGFGSRACAPATRCMAAAARTIASRSGPTAIATSRSSFRVRAPVRKSRRRRYSTTSCNCARTRSDGARSLGPVSWRARRTVGLRELRRPSSPVAAG